MRPQMNVARGCNARSVHVHVPPTAARVVAELQCSRKLGVGPMAGNSHDKREDVFGDIKQAVLPF